MRVSIMGVGRMGRRHIAVLKDLGLELVSVSDANPESINLTQHEFGLKEEQLFDNTASLLKRTQPEFVIIASTTDSHYELSLAAAKSGAKYILCEKPMAASLNQADEMISTCKALGVSLAVNHYMRFIPLGQRLSEIIKSEAFGGMLSMTISAANCGLVMVGSHYLELFRYLADEDFTSASGWLDIDPAPNPRGNQFQDRAGSVRLSTAGGKVFYMHSGLQQGHSIKVIVAGAYGQVVIDPYVGTLQVSMREHANRDLATSRYVSPSQEQNESLPAIDTLAGTKAVINALINSGNYSSGSISRNVIAALVAAYVSDESGNSPVNIEDSCLPLERVFPWA